MESYFMDKSKSSDSNFAGVNVVSDMIEVRPFENWPSVSLGNPVAIWLNLRWFRGINSFRGRAENLSIVLWDDWVVFPDDEEEKEEDEVVQDKEVDLDLEYFPEQVNGGAVGLRAIRDIIESWAAFRIQDLYLRLRVGSRELRFNLRRTIYCKNVSFWCVPYMWWKSWIVGVW